MSAGDVASTTMCCLGPFVFLALAAAAGNTPAAKERAAAAQKKRAEAQQRIVCPHCVTAGYVTTQSVQVKTGVSGGKATAALLTGGTSLLAVGLSQKKRTTKATCSNCMTTWYI